MKTRRVALLLGFAPLLSAAAAAQTFWLQQAPPVSPPARFYHAMAHDWLRDRVVLFGGYDGSWNPLADTWEYDGTTWQQRTTAHVPPGGIGEMAYDRGRGCVVRLSGGPGTSQTWEFDGVDWTQRVTAHAPAPQGNHRIVYDSARGVIVAYMPDASNTSQTWEYAGADWIRRFPANAPGALGGAQMAFDPLRGRTILHGGYYLSTTPVATWEYDGNNWILASNSPQNPAISNGACAFDAGRRRMVVYGGFGIGGTWEYDGVSWQLRTMVSPPQRADTAMVYDLLRQDCLLFGGGGGGGVLNDTYRYRVLNPAIAAPYGQGCAGPSSVVPGLLPQPYQLPYTGLIFGVRFYSLASFAPAFVAVGFSNTQWNGVGLPVSLSSIGMTGCQLLVSPDVLFPATPTSANAAAWSLGIPSQGSLVGAQFYLQGLVLESGANPAGLVDTRAIECRIGAP